MESLELVVVLLCVLLGLGRGAAVRCLRRRCAAAARRQVCWLLPEQCVCWLPVQHSLCSPLVR